MAARKRIITTAVLLAGTGAAATAHALDNDPALHRLCVRDGSSPAAQPCGKAPTPDQAAFRDLSREYGFLFGSTLLAPAETMGINGFQLNAQIGVNSVNGGEEYWARGVEDEDPEDILTTMRFDARKGLPYSFEVGMSATYLLESELWAFGGAVKWALNEAVDAFPVDIAVRGSVNRTVGSPQLTLTTAGFDLIISRSFGAGGVANIAPYLAYSPMWVIARSGVIDATPGDGSDPESSFVFAEETQVIHRGVLGTRFILGAFNFTPQVALGPSLLSIDFNVGVDF